MFKKPLLLGTLFILLSSSALAELTFFVGSDSHYGTFQWETNEQFNKSIIEDMNQLPSTPYPSPLQGKVGVPRGVIVNGDITNKGTYWEWNGWWLFGLWNRDGFVDDYGLRGDGLLKYPVYEGYGNHDMKDSSLPILDSIIKRNKSRGVPVTTSENGFHYSWDWEGIHFIQLNTFPGSRNMAKESLSFLKDDLREKAGDTHRPIIILQHYAWDNDSINRWWTDEERDAYYDAIKNYNIIAIFCGHSHILEHTVWQGIDTFSSGTLLNGEYFVCKIENHTLTVAERKIGSWGSFLFTKEY